MPAEIQLVTGYNVFRRKTEINLCCAVRQDKPIPTFIETSGWEFRGVVYENGDAPIPNGFKPAVAHKATATDGYYVFYEDEFGTARGTRARMRGEKIGAGLY